MTKRSALDRTKQGSRRMFLKISSYTVRRAVKKWVRVGQVHYQVQNCHRAAMFMEYTCLMSDRQSELKKMLNPTGMINFLKLFWKSVASKVINRPFQEGLAPHSILLHESPFVTKKLRPCWTGRLCLLDMSSEGRLGWWDKSCHHPVGKRNKTVR